jgi:hypothetical protein
MKRIESSLCAAFVLAGGLLAGGSAFAQEISGFTHAGEGCPSGTVGHVYNPTTETLTITFDNYTVDMNTDGTGNPSSNCNVDVVIRVPNRPLQVSWNKVQYLGYLDKGTGVTAELRRRYQYDMNPPVQKVRTWPPSESFSGDFNQLDEFPGWSSCSNQVTASLTSRLTLRGTPNRYSEMVMDREHIQTKMIYYFGFAPC